MRKMKKLLSVVLVVCMMAGYLPANVKAATVDETLTASLAEAKAYTDALTINNTSNDPATVVKKFGTHFTWDNEKRESSKSYLFDWSYYNGVVFEGIEYLYEVTKDETYKDYVVEYMSSMITEAGGWATCSNNSSKQCAGYNATHGADCYKTASLLLDAYEMTNDQRYLTMAATLYADLDTAAKSYSLSKAGNNYRHTWASDSTPDLWLDGLYMILPFRAEYAKHIKDTEELDLIVSRMQWVSDNMYNSTKGLFYHAADSASSNSGTYWLRSIGWYAAAIVDIMDSMEGENLEAMKAQLVKLVDGMKACQNTTNGMWLNNMAASQSSTNPYETSGTALVCYAVMKAVNEGWLDASYADMAIKAFNGICNEKLSNNNLTDICFKGAPGDSNSTFYDNEGKGVGPFIMFYAEMQEYVNDQATETPTPTTQKVTVDGTEITVTNIIGLEGNTVTDTDKELIEAKDYVDYRAYDLTATLAEGATSNISMKVPTEWNATEDRLVGISVEKGELKEIKGTLKDGVYSFDVNHFSAKGIALLADEAGEDTTVTNTATGNLVGGKVYTLDTNGVTKNKNYLIVNTNSGTGYALTNNNGTAGRTKVEISNSTITVEEDTDIAWQFSGTTSGTVGNNGRYVYPNNGSLDLNTSGTNLTISNRDNGAYRIYRSETTGSWYNQTTYHYYLRYNNSAWTGGRTTQTSSIGSVYLYELTSSSAGEAVTFTLEPSKANLKVGGTTNLATTVKVGNNNATSSEIVWTSSDSNVATVDANGKVTAVGAGEATITATLKNANDTALAEDLVLTSKINVSNKTIVEGSEVLTGNDPVTTKINVEPDFSNIKLTVTYDDGSEGVITVDNGLEITDYDITTVGYSYATISYNGKEYGTVRVTVGENPYEGKEEATEYPKYPEDGAVRIDKTAKEVDFENTGVVQVELDVAGVSVKPAVDVILVTDLSNSMAWAAGGRTDAASHEETKVYDLQKSVASFADIFLADDDDGNATKNTMSLVTFGGYDADHTKKVYTAYADPTQTLVLGSKDAESVKDTVNNIRVLADDVLNIGTSTTGYYLSFDGGKTYGENYGNTNYDHAFMQTADAIKNLKAAYAEENDGASYDASGRQIYVLFMTDGAPSNYDGVYYSYKTGDRADVNCTWVNEDGEEVTYTMGNNRAQYGEAAWFQYIAGGTYNTTTETIPGNPLYWADQVYNTKGVANIYNIGFDLDNGGFSNMVFTEENNRPLSKVLEKLVTGKTLEVFSADKEEDLSKIYADLATKIRYAGTNANVTDIVDSDFTLQLTQTTGGEDATVNGDLKFKPTIELKAYELWTKEETTDVTKIGTRKTNADGTYKYTTLETVSFNDEGTEAYSDKENNGTETIMSTADDGTVTIEAHYFTYTKTPEGVETFKWRLGNITDQEVALSFYAYLKGSMEGERPKGLYYTNEEAILEYVDVNDKHATQTFPVPAVAWGGASTSYEFYLVNGEGKPCDRNGNEVPFANRVIITGPYYEELYLNQEDEEKAKEIIAAYVLPAGYTLYDETAKYTVTTASGNRDGQLVVSEPAAGKAQTTIVVSATKPTYIQSRVAFGVVYNLIPEEAEFELTPNEVIIDYGKTIEIKTNDNETIQSGFEATLVGFSKYYDSVDLKHKFTTTSAVDDFEASYGTFSIKDAASRTVEYTPKKLVDSVEKIFCVVKMTNKSNAEDYYYMVDRLYVIPATTMYYETNIEDVFEFTTTSGDWETRTAGAEADGPQNDGTIGKDQTYGYDSTYNNDTHYSNGSSLFVNGQGIKLNENSTSYTQAQFSFTGTGFDIISRTGTSQGAIRVDIYKDAARKTLEKSVTVLNKSESNLELYQIPVVSVNDLKQGTYYVNIGVNAAYTNTTYPQLNRGGEFYFDAIRVYNPTEETIATDAYKADNENNMSLIEVRNQLINAGDYDSTSENSGVTFVDRIYTGENPGEDVGVDVGTYSTIGPNNEVYLANGQAIAFRIEWTGKTPSSIDVGAKSITGGAANIQAFISGDDEKPTTAVVNEKIESSTVQFKELVNADNASDFSATKEAYVFITNTGESVLSITDIKIGYGNVSNTVGEVEFVSDENTTVFATRCAELTYAKPVAEKAVIKSVKTDKSSYVVKDTVKATITTNTATEYITVNGKKITNFTEEADERIWTYSVKTAKANSVKIKVVAYNEQGEASDKVVKTVSVKKFAPKTFKLSSSKYSVKKGQKYTVIVKTSTDVKYVTINGKKVTAYTSNSAKTTKSFKVTYTAKTTGKKTVKAVAYNENGAASNTKTITVTVKK